MKDLTKFDADLEEARRRHMLKPEFGRNPRKREAEYKLGKKAYCKGDAEKANPYRAGSLSAELWLEGWHAADIKKAKRA